MKSEKFKISLEDRINKEFKVSSDFNDFRWQGTTFDTDQLKVEGFEGAFFSKLRADGIRARINIGAVKRRVWEVAGLDINRINLLIDSDRSTDLKKHQDTDQDESEEARGSGILKHFLPNKLDINQIRVGEFNFNYFNDEFS